MTCQAHPWGLPTGPLKCVPTTTGPDHTHRFEASGSPDPHDADEALAERRHEL